MKFPKIVYIFICTLFFASCSQNLDFSQIDDFSVSSVYNNSLVYFKLTPSKFIDPNSGNEIDLPTDVTNITFFQYRFIKKNLAKAVFNLEIKNEIHRDIDIQVNFLNSNNNIVYQLNQLNIAANQLDFKHEEIVEVSGNPSILNATRVSVKVNLSPSGTALSSSDTSEFEFKSSVSLFIETN